VEVLLPGRDAITVPSFAWCRAPRRRFLYRGKPRRARSRPDFAPKIASRSPAARPATADHLGTAAAQTQRPITIATNDAEAGGVSLSSTCIHRLILTTLSITIVVFVIGFCVLGVRQYPSVDPAVITVRTEYPGTNADVIDRRSAAARRGHQRRSRNRMLNSVSRDGRSDITIEFELGVDLRPQQRRARQGVQAPSTTAADADPPSCRRQTPRDPDRGAQRDQRLAQPAAARDLAQRAQGT
jgi:hypothetical protein